MTRARGSDELDVDVDVGEDGDLGVKGIEVERVRGEV
jgi:hypothetical protein